MSLNVLGVFNAFDVANAGGIQVSGSIAWQALRAAQDIDAHALMLSLEPVAEPATDARVAHATGRIRAMVAAHRAPRSVDVALFWHLDSLKLLPFFRFRRGCKIALFLHGTESWRRRGAWTRRAIAHVDVVLANSAYTLNRSVRANPELAARKAEIVHLGIGEPQASDDFVTAPPPAALMLSRLERTERYKGHDEMIAAWPLVLDRMPDAQLWIAGEGDLREDLENRVADAGLDHAIRFFGRVSEEEKLALLRRARCFALPSTGEGFGLVYLEAMRCGRPCLTGIDAGREVVNPPEAGLSVTHRTPREIADAVLRLLRTDEEERARAHAARARYERDYTATHFTHRLLKALRTAAR